MPNARRVDSYLICATPRTGSSLLCGLLGSTGVAGHPESYFREPDERAWATRWEIVRQTDGAFSYSDYIRAALVAGRTENGVFAARVMWGTVDYVAAKLASTHPDVVASDRAVLQRSFGLTRFVYLWRRDTVAQAVSWLRAEQTDVWVEGEGRAGTEPEQQPSYDFDQIRALVQLIGDHNAAWQEWFTAGGIRPHPVVYEELAVDPVGVTRRVLDFLGLELPADREIAVQHKRLADNLNVQWIERYKAAVDGS